MTKRNNYLAPSLLRGGHSQVAGITILGRHRYTQDPAGAAVVIQLAIIWPLTAPPASLPLSLANLICFFWLL